MLPTSIVWLDAAIVGIVAVSALLGLLRGLTREVFSLVIWLCALAIGLVFYKEVAVHLEADFATPAIRLAAAFGALVAPTEDWTYEAVAPRIRLAGAFAILVLATLLAGGIFRYLLSILVKKSGLTGTDRVLGALFGLARGAVLIAMVGFLGALTPLPGEDWWRGSLLIGRFQVLAERMLERMPAPVTDALKRL